PTKVPRRDAAAEPGARALPPAAVRGQPLPDHRTVPAARWRRLRSRRAIPAVTHPVNGLDEVVHQRVRLGILAIAREAKTVDSGFLQTTLELTAGNLSHNLTVLEGAGWSASRRATRANGPEPECRSPPPAGEPSAQRSPTSDS